MLIKFSTNNLKSNWILRVKQILDESGFSNVFDMNDNLNVFWLKNSIHRRLLDQFIQSWKSEIFNSPKGLSYRIFKEEWKFEEYLDLLDKKDRNNFCKFRTTNHHLPIETGRWQSIERNNRKCLYCNKNDLGDEYHYLFVCSFFKLARNQCLSFYYRENANTLKFKQLFETKDHVTLRKLCKFINVVNTILCPP